MDIVVDFRVESGNGCVGPRDETNPSVTPLPEGVPVLGWQTQKRRTLNSALPFDSSHSVTLLQSWRAADRQEIHRSCV